MEKRHKNVEELGYKSIPALMWQYFLPSLTGVILNAMYNIVDRIFIGQAVGADALAGVSVVFPIMLIIIGFGTLAGVGAGVRISLNLGEKNIARAEKVLGNGFCLMILISVFITIVGLAVKTPVLEIFGASRATIKYANDYLTIILMGSTFQIIGYGINNLIRSEGSAKVAMYSMIISAGSNILLDPLFIFVLDMGVKGAAYATVISQILLSVWVVAHFLSKSSVLKLKLKNFKLKGDIVWYIVSIGFAPFFMQIASSFVQGTINTQLINYGGDIAVAALGIIMSVAMMIILAILAVNMAAQPIISFNYGAKHYLRVKQTLKIAMLAASAISLLGFLFMELFPQSIILTFNNESKELLNIGIRGFRVFCAAFPLIGFQIVVGNYYQAIGKAGISAFLSLLRQVIVLIPLLLILPEHFGLTGVWLSGSTSDTISAMIVAGFLFFEWRKLSQLTKLPKQ